MKPFPLQVAETAASRSTSPEAVCQLNLDLSGLLLHSGAPASRTAAGLPVLLHFLEAFATAASAGSGSTTSSGGGGSTSSYGGTSSRAATPSSGMPPRHLSMRGRSPEDIATSLQNLENQLKLLRMLLASGACPLERPAPPHPDRCFLSGVCEGLP